MPVSSSALSKCPAQQRELGTVRDTEAGYRYWPAARRDPDLVSLTQSEISIVQSGSRNRGVWQSQVASQVATRESESDSKARSESSGFPADESVRFGLGVCSALDAKPGDITSACSSALSSLAPCSVELCRYSSNSKHTQEQKSTASHITYCLVVNCRAMLLDRRNVMVTPRWRLDGCAKCTNLINDNDCPSSTTRSAS